MTGKMDEQQIGRLTLLSKGLEACQGNCATLGYDDLSAGELTIGSLEGISQSDGIFFGMLEAYTRGTICPNQIGITFLAHGCVFCPGVDVCPDWVEGCE